jgi:periplasmic copper chaperone A
MRTGWLKASAALATVGATVVGVSAIASAHVEITPEEAPGGETSLLTFAFTHGCDGSSTTEIRIQMPESVPVVTPTINPGWDVDKVMEPLDTPIEGAHGEELTERVSEVVYTAKAPIPDGYRDTFVLSLALPDTPGETVYFPTIQTCEEGETAWIEIPAEGQGEEDLDAPAPAVTIIEGTGGDHHDDDEFIPVTSDAVGTTATATDATS